MAIPSSSSVSLANAIGVVFEVATAGTIGSIQGGGSHRRHGEARSGRRVDLRRGQHQPELLGLDHGLGIAGQDRHRHADPDRTTICRGYSGPTVAQRHHGQQPGDGRRLRHAGGQRRDDQPRQPPQRQCLCDGDRLAVRSRHGHQHRQRNHAHHRGRQQFDDLLRRVQRGHPGQPVGHQDRHGHVDPERHGRHGDRRPDRPGRDREPGRQRGRSGGLRQPLSPLGRARCCLDNSAGSANRVPAACNHADLDGGTIDFRPNQATGAVQTITNLGNDNWRRQLHHGALGRRTERDLRVRHQHQRHRATGVRPWSRPRTWAPRPRARA